MFIRPAGARILVRPDVANRTSGGLILPDTARANAPPMTGRVLAVGRGRLVVTTAGPVMETVQTCKEGDHIMYKRYHGSDVELDGVEHVILTDDHVLCVMEASPAGASVKVGLVTVTPAPPAPVTPGPGADAGPGTATAVPR